jgi:probable rRNA maturation factor
MMSLVLVQVTYSAKPSWFDRLTTNGTQPLGLSLSKASGNRRPRRSPDYALGPVYHAVGAKFPSVTSLSTREIDISIADSFQDKLSEEWLEEVVGHALQVALPPDEPCQVSLAIVDDVMIQELNRQYRGLEEVTDVLSFSTVHQGHWEGEDDLASEYGEGPTVVSTQGEHTDAFVFPTGETPPLGEVIISYPQALRQAQNRNDAVEREVALLIVHGVLHLVGHDHLDVEDTAIMKAKEQIVLEALFPSGADNS